MKPAASKTNHQPLTSLDPDTLFLLRIRHIEDTPNLQTNRKFRSEEDLCSYLDSIDETINYFRTLKRSIGKYDDTASNRNIRQIKKENAWQHVKSYLYKLPSYKFTRINDINYVCYIFGFKDANELMKVVYDSESTSIYHDVLNSEELNNIATALGFENWKVFANKDSNRYYLSESLLMRAYGKHKSKSALSTRYLNYISNYICDMNWDEYDRPANREKVRNAILRRVVKPGMTTVVTQLQHQSKAKEAAFPEMVEGDKILITHADGTSEYLEFVDGKLRPAIKQSEMCA